MLRCKATKEKAQIRLWAKNKALQPGSKLAVRHPSFSQAGDPSQPAFAANERDVHPSTCGACVSR
ncbi:hypothetical protein HOY82DRAFT_512633 [Tuber indicum]|nr:hypothetical protein HOY82DRAFT_512633 [Tuber indicum]